MEFLLGVETEFQKLVAKVDGELATKAKAFAEAAAPVVDLIAKGVQVLGTLRARSRRSPGRRLWHRWSMWRGPFR